MYLDDSKGLPHLDETNTPQSFCQNICKLPLCTNVLDHQLLGLDTFSNEMELGVDVLASAMMNQIPTEGNC